MEKARQTKCPENGAPWFLRGVRFVRPPRAPCPSGSMRCRAGLPAAALQARLRLPMCTHSDGCLAHKQRKPGPGRYGGGPAQVLHLFPYSPGLATGHPAIFVSYTVARRARFRQEAGGVPARKRQNCHFPQKLLTAWPILRRKRPAGGLTSAALSGKIMASKVYPFKCVDGDKAVRFDPQRAAGRCKAAADLPCTGSRAARLNPSRAVGRDGTPPLQGEWFAVFWPTMPSGPFTGQ